MKPLRNFSELVSMFSSMETKKTVAFVCPDDEASAEVVTRCLEKDLARFLLIASKKGCDKCAALIAKFPQATLFETEGVDEASRLGVSLVREGKADVLMKGSVNTDNLLRAVLDKENGLLQPGNVMTHVTAVEAPAYDKLLFVSDVAVIPRPTLEQFDTMIKYDTTLVRHLGIEHPRVALIHFTEKVNQKFPHTLDYVEIMRRAAEGAYGEAYVSGPMDVKTAVDAHSAEVKGIVSEVVGKADILIFPTLEAGNVFYKTISFFGKASMAGILLGTMAPIVVPSRADSADSKFYSLVLACLAGRN